MHLQYLWNKTDLASDHFSTCTSISTNPQLEPHQTRESEHSVHSLIPCLNVYVTLFLEYVKNVI
jgi:hypothetical protein